MCVDLTNLTLVSTHEQSISSWYVSAESALCLFAYHVFVTVCDHW